MQKEIIKEKIQKLQNTRIPCLEPDIQVVILYLVLNRNEDCSETCKIKKINFY